MPPRWVTRATLMVFMSLTDGRVAAGLPCRVAAGPSALAVSGAQHSRSSSRSRAIRLCTATSHSPDEVLRARLTLFATSALWGTYPTLLKLLYAADGAAPLTPLTVTVARFALMAMVGQAVLSQPAVEPAQEPVPTLEQPTLTPASTSAAFVPTPAFVLAAAELGLWGCGGTQLNSLALQDLTAVRGTVLLATVNILTPALQRVFGSTIAQRRIERKTWLACVLALACTILAVEGDALAAASGAASGAASASTATSNTALSAADGLVLCAAACYAMAKVRLGTFVQSFPAQRLAAGRLQSQFAFVLILGSGVLASGGMDPSAASAWAQTLSPSQILLLIVSALAPGAGATLLQAEGQRVIPAANAQPIYASMPLFAAGWACLLLHEPLTTTEIVGGIGSCAAAWLASTGGLPPAMEAGKESVEAAEAEAGRETNDSSGMSKAMDAYDGSVKPVARSGERGTKERSSDVRMALAL